MINSISSSSSSSTSSSISTSISRVFVRAGGSWATEQHVPEPLDTIRTTWTRHYLRSIFFPPRPPS